MTKSLTNYETEIDKIADEIYEAKQSFFRATLKQMIAFKCFLGRKLSDTKWGDGAVVQIADKVGISETTLFDAQKMYRQEKLTAPKEKEFVEKFTEDYSSWNDYKQKKFALNCPSVDKDECKHCKAHCPTV